MGLEDQVCQGMIGYPVGWDMIGSERGGEWRRVRGSGVVNEGCGGMFQGSGHAMMYGDLSFILVGFARRTLLS